MNCPDCERELERQDSNIFFCKACEKRYHVEIIEEKKNYEILPELPVGTEIYVNNRQHKLHLEQGTVTEKSHRYYRVKLRNGIIWMPEHWIEPLPKELRRNV